MYLLVLCAGADPQQKVGQERKVTLFFFFFPFFLVSPSIYKCCSRVIRSIVFVLDVVAFVDDGESPFCLHVPTKTQDYYCLWVAIKD